MIRNYIDITQCELNNLFKRLDTDRDARITLSEFKRLFNITKGSSLLSSGNFSSSSNFSTTFGKSSLRSSRTVGVESPERSPINANNTVSRLYSPIRERTMNILNMNRSVERLDNLNRSVERLDNFNRSVERLDLNRSAVRSPQRSLSPRFERLIASNGFGDRSIQSCFKSSGNCLTYEEENFVAFLRDLIEIENEVEKAKIDLTYRTDFNVEDAFRNFELDGRGYVTDVDIKYGLNGLDVFATREEIVLLIKRYDIQGEGDLR